jgi:hypothetical protein
MYPFISYISFSWVEKYGTPEFTAFSTVDDQKYLTLFLSGLPDSVIGSAAFAKLKSPRNKTEAIINAERII